MLGCILALQCQQQYLIGKQFDILTEDALNQYVLYSQTLSHRQFHWVEVLVDYAANFVYKPGRVLFAPDALSKRPALHIIDKNKAFLEAVRLAQEYSADQEFINFQHLATQPKSDFQVTKGPIVRKISSFLPLVIPGSASGLHQKGLKELHTTPLGGHLVYHKLLRLVHFRFQWPYLTSSVQEFYH